MYDKLFISFMAAILRAREDLFGSNIGTCRQSNLSVLSTWLSPDALLEAKQHKYLVSHRHIPELPYSACMGGRP